MSKPNIAEAATKLVELLTPFDSDERRRIVQAALTLLGEGSVSPPRIAPMGSNSDGIEWHPRTNAWLHQNGLDATHLEQVFHVDGETVEVIAPSIPGKTDKERSLNAYLLAGTARLVGSGEASFDDKMARRVCKNLGCFNETNHASYLKDKGNKIAGSKEAGWKLTAPGLVQAAAIIKEMTRG